MAKPTSRRSFLKTSGQLTTATAVTAAVTTLGAVHSQAAVELDKLVVGIIGCGGIMSLHVKGLV